VPAASSYKNQVKQDNFCTPVPIIVVSQEQAFRSICSKKAYRDFFFC